MTTPTGWLSRLDTLARSALRAVSPGYGLAELEEAVEAAPPAVQREFYRRAADVPIIRFGESARAKLAEYEACLTAARKVANA